jgi:hypothetical protein
MIAAKTSVTALAAVTGILLLNKPNKNHNKVPNVKSEYIDNEMPDVSLVRMVLTACGKKETVVQNAAINPVIVMSSIKISIQVISPTR